MSIISDALRKAQEKRLARSNREPSQTADSSDQALFEETPPPEKTWSLPVKRNFLLAAVLGLALLACVALVLLFMLFSGISVKPHATAFETAAQTGVPSGLASPDISRLSSDSDNKLFPVEKTTALPVLNGIMYTPTRPQAVINGRMVDEGERIGGFTVLLILPDRVILESDGKEYELELR